MSWVSFELIDSSPRLIIKIEKQEVSGWDKMITFTAPFSGQLWLLIAVVAVATAIFMWWFESSTVDSEEERRCAKGAGRLVESVWLALCQFTGGASHEPVTIPGRLVYISWAFFHLDRRVRLHGESGSFFDSQGRCTEWSFGRLQRRKG